LKLQACCDSVDCWDR